MDFQNSLCLGENGFPGDCENQASLADDGLQMAVTAFWLESPQAPSARQVPNARVGERTILMGKILKILQGGVCRKSQVYVNVKRTQKFQ